MRKLILGSLFVLPLALSTSANALPGMTDPGQTSLLRDRLTSQDVIEVKGGGHGMGRGHAGRAFGWGRGRKVGWRGRGCPPGLWKQGRC
jgi:hypothetical protein